MLKGVQVLNNEAWEEFYTELSEETRQAIEAASLTHLNQKTKHPRATLGVKDRKDLLDNG